MLKDVLSEFILSPADIIESLKAAASSQQTLIDELSLIDQQCAGFDDKADVSNEFSEIMKSNVKRLDRCLARLDRLSVVIAQIANRLRKVQVYLAASTQHLTEENATLEATINTELNTGSTD